MPRLIKLLVSLLALFGCLRWQASHAAEPYLIHDSDRRLLDALHRHVAAEAWDDAIELAHRLLDIETDRVVAIEERDCYVGLEQYVHRVIAKFPQAAMDRYRQLVDPTAAEQVREALEQRDARVLEHVVDRSFCSSWGDNALMALGELALERGDYQTARRRWMQLGPLSSGVGLIYPDSDVPKQDILARLILVSIREGHWSRAERELKQLADDYPDARGWMAGREVNYADQLSSLLQKARLHPPQSAPQIWPLDAASAERADVLGVASPEASYRLVWSKPLVAGPNEQLATFPVIADGLVIYQDEAGVHGLRLADGEENFSMQDTPFRSLSEPKRQFPFALTVSGLHVFGVTATASDVTGMKNQNVGWGIDLRRDGALAHRITSKKKDVVFRGSPIVENGRWFVAIRSSGRSPRAGIEAYDLAGRKLLWRRWLCHASFDATDSDWLAHDAGIVYYRTALGAIAAMRAEDGRLLWLRVDESSSDSPPSRDEARMRASQCVYYRGNVYYLSAKQTLVALDGATGALLWEQKRVDPVPQLIGVAGEHLIFANNRVHVFHSETGRQIVEHNRPRPTGQAILFYGQIFWPANGNIYRFEATEPTTSFSSIILPEKGGANLAAVGDYLIAAGTTRLSVFRANDQNEANTSR